MKKRMVKKISTKLMASGIVKAATNVLLSVYAIDKKIENYFYNRLLEMELKLMKTCKPDELVIAREMDNSIVASVEHKHDWHGVHNGFEVGDTHPGSVELAINILYDVAGELPDPAISVVFKRKCISKIQLSHGQRIVLNRQKIYKWYQTAKEIIATQDISTTTLLEFETPEVEGGGK